MGRDCAALDIPFILELLVYPFPGEAAHHADYAEDAAKQAALVLESVRHFAAPEFGVDLFKLECPVPTAVLPAPEDAAGCDRLRSEALPYLRALSELTTRAARPADLTGPGLADIAKEGDFVASIAPRCT